MHVIIMGCGRVGSSLAHTLDADGHSVAVIDRSPEAFRRLDGSFGGTTVTGTGFDRDVLAAAGAPDAYALAAVSSGDNSNILAARVARETFGVRNVAARIYDPRRAQIFERLGIPTVATVRWTAQQMMRHLVPQGALTEYGDPSGRIVLAEVRLDPGWTAHPVSDVEAAASVRVAYLTRLGEGIVAKPGLLVQDGDAVHIVCERDSLDDAIRILDRAPGDLSGVPEVWR